MKESMQKYNRLTWFLALLLSSVSLVLVSCTDDADDDDAATVESTREYLDPVSNTNANRGAYSPECTYCGSNTLNNVAEPNVLIDHVFIKNSNISVSDMIPEIIFKDTVTLSTGETTNLSDHYGVKVATHDFAVTSYNLGLAYGYVPLALERRPALESAIQEHSTDVLCMQEVWTEDDAEAIKTAATAGGYSYNYRVQGEDELFPTAQCTSADITAIMACGNANCSGQTGTDLTSCVQTFCAADIGALFVTNKSCLGAFMAQIGSLDLTTLESTVTVPSSIYAFNGSNGLLIVSKKALMNTEVIHLDSTTTRRAILYAKTSDNAEKEAHLFCTHLSAILLDVPYVGEHKDWATEQSQQIDVLLNLAESKAYGKPQYLIGDFNTGKADEEHEIAAEAGDNYEKIP
jgi:endonuclease/exonuclease/phosphatase family metal-dependent hydrolase